MSQISRNLVVADLVLVGALAGRATPPQNAFGRDLAVVNPATRGPTKRTSHDILTVSIHMTRDLLSVVCLAEPRGQVATGRRRRAGLRQRFVTAD